ncbi:MAG: hypothetical protein IKI57_00905 [Clostridia bacterium]|nr:hypothetical protein [Clostridia bacterium]
MDNVSKALIMAGAVFIAILIISVFVYSLGIIREYNYNSSTLTAAVQNESFNRYFIYATVPSAYGVIKGYDAYNLIEKAADMNRELFSNQISIYYNGTKIHDAPSGMKEDNTLLKRNFQYEYSIR